MKHDTEKRALQALEAHPELRCHIARLLAYDDDTLTLVVQYRGRSAAKTSKVAKEAVSLLHALEAVGIYHNDLHWGNVLQDECGLSLIDFDCTTFQPRHQPYTWAGLPPFWFPKRHTATLASVSNLAQTISYAAYAAQTTNSNHTRGGYSGYNTLRIPMANGKFRTLDGLRDPRDRMASLAVDFTNKTVLDIGCDAGGVLFELQQHLAHGVGLDVNPQLVNAANLHRSLAAYRNLDFYVFDVHRDPVTLIPAFLTRARYDYVFLLSYAPWAGRWRELVQFAALRAERLVFEADVTALEKEKQVGYVRRWFAHVDCVRGGKGHTLYLCTHALRS